MSSRPKSKRTAQHGKGQGHMLLNLNTIFNPRQILYLLASAKDSDFPEIYVDLKSLDSDMFLRAYAHSIIQAYSLDKRQMTKEELRWIWNNVESQISENEFPFTVTDVEKSVEMQLRGSKNTIQTPSPSPRLFEYSSDEEKQQQQPQQLQRPRPTTGALSPRVDATAFRPISFLTFKNITQSRRKSRHSTK